MKKDKKNILKIIFINSFILLFLITFGELLARIFFSDFKGEYFSEKITRSKKYHKGIIDEITVVRIPNKSWKENTDSDLLILVGDSITQGYGMAYEDIYWVKLKNLYDLTKKNNLEVLPIGGYGTNLNVGNFNFKSLSKIANNFSKKKYVVYQFNFNDIVPKEKFLPAGEIKIRNNLQTNFREFTVRHLHKSVFFRVVRHYGGLASRQKYKKKTCMQRGELSLQSYTYTYGSKGFEEVSEVAWSEFEKNLIKFKNFSNQINAEFIMFISPLIYDIDLSGAHPFMNAYLINLSCATIDPRKRLEKIAIKNDIKFIDPTSYMRERFESSLKEGNFLRFFFAADDNHITPRAATFLGHYLYSEIFYNSK